MRVAFWSAGVDAVGLVGIDDLVDLAQQAAQQRLALARAWARQPDVLLLDEPTASLDPHAKRDVETLIAEFAAGQGRPAAIRLRADGIPDGNKLHRVRRQDDAQQERPFFVVIARND